ncbi:MAG: UbiA family prenyltransferase [Candidatus Latescibacterota bacterium]|nr:MAG: UbiA family prenyltransferase [Candidatus Latescibacterota bacterium]
MLTFIREYIKSMRLYYSFVTGIAGWIGVAYYEYVATFSPDRTIEVAPPPEKKLVILILLFLSWGINQIINDYLGREEDKINAPDRPMVTGKLNPTAALLVSFGLILVTAIVTWFYLEPFALVFLGAGVALNLVYEYAKGYGTLGNVVFGLMITMATLFGAYASGPTESTVFLSHRISILILIWLINALMTFYTYFKDYEGDKAAGKRTLVVKYGTGTARILAIASSFLPTIVFVLLRITKMHEAPLNMTFIVLGVLTVFLQIWTGVLYYLNPTGEKTYESLEVNFRAGVCGQAALIALFNPDLAMWLFMFSYIFVGFIFELHKNPKM